VRLTERSHQSIKLAVYGAKTGLKILGRLSVSLCLLDLLSDEGNAFRGEGIGRPTQWTILRIVIGGVIR
jgi:hypothetical protein